MAVVGVIAPNSYETEVVRILSDPVGVPGLELLRRMFSAHRFIFFQREMEYEVNAVRVHGLK